MKYVCYIHHRGNMAPKILEKSLILLELWEVLLLRWSSDLEEDRVSLCLSHCVFPVTPFLCTAVASAQSSPSLSPPFSFSSSQ